MSSFNDFFEYHMKTKHSYFSIRNSPNRLDWNNQPKKFKSYPETFKRIKLDLEKETHSFLYYIAGITAKKSYPGVEYFLRVNPSAGALFPNEIYFQSRKNSDFEDGIYHFDIRSSSVTLIKTIEEEGIEPFFGIDKCQNGFIFLISSLYYRSCWKYKNRALRYCLLDAGHVLGSLEISTYIHSKQQKIIYDFDKEGLNELFNFNTKEFFTSAVFVTMPSQKSLTKVELEIPTIPCSINFERNSLIEEAYKDSIKIRNKKEENSLNSFSFQKDYLKEVVLNRRSIREFSKASILKREFESILSVVNSPISSDCDEELDIYCVINRVEGMKLGLYKNNEYKKEGDFINKARYLCLEQALGGDSAVTFFITSKSNNYQAMYQKAGILGHRMYIASNYLGIQCSGIGAYYDDEVCEFIGETTQVLYAVAIGK